VAEHDPIRAGHRATALHRRSITVVDDLIGDGVQDVYYAILVHDDPFLSRLLMISFQKRAEQ
jgi:hypothetical protein